LEPKDDDEIEKISICHTGSENDLNYYYNNNDNQLYRMDGLSIQSMENGYYVFNDQWKEFNSNYPEVPYIIIKCENYNCGILKNELNINSDILINKAGTFGNKLLKFFMEGDELKFLNAYQPGYYFLNNNSEVTVDAKNPIYTNIYEINENDDLNQLNDTMMELLMNDNTIYINYAKKGNFARNRKEFAHILLKYDQEKDILIFDNDSNLNNNITLFKFLNENASLYKINSHKLIPQKEGVYAIKHDKVFAETEWTNLNLDQEICYYHDEKCNRVGLLELMNHKYLINKANDKLSILEYNKEKDKWRVVKEDGYYFFFDGNHSISRVDRRIEKVVQIIDGVAMDVTFSKKLLGYFIFDGLMIEGNGDGWEDAHPFEDNVDVVLNKQCTSYENNHTIHTDDFCYDNNLGICVVKAEIESNSFNTNNCIFSQNNKVKYYYKNGYLYSFNKQMNQRMNRSGLYVIDRFKTPYGSKIEREVNAYSCDGYKCELVENMDSQYYLNMAYMNDEHPLILKYQNTTKEWNKTINDGYYFFNERGYPITENDEITYCYFVKNNGNTIENIKNHEEKGIYVSQSNPFQEIVLINNGKWTKTIHVPKCQYDEINNRATSDDTIKEGDICLDEKRIVLIKGMIENETETESKIIYDAVAVSHDHTHFIYDYITTEKKLITLNYDTLRFIEINGFAVIDTSTKLPLQSYSPTKATLYRCDKSRCELIQMPDTLISEKYYINEISSEMPFIQYNGNHQWQVVRTEGYYFLNENMEPVGENETVFKAIKITGNENNSKQYDITKSKSNIGLYLNKISNYDNYDDHSDNGNIIIKNNGDYWMKGEASSLHLCNISIIENKYLCRTFDDNQIIYNKGDYCYNKDTNQLYLLTDKVYSENDSFNCISASNDKYKYIMSDTTNGLLNGMEILNNRLMELTKESITLASPGYYIIDENGEIIDEDTINIGRNDDKGINVYRCTRTECTKENNLLENVILSVTGTIYEYDGETDKLFKTTKEGIYFFRDDGFACSSEDDEIANIMKVVRDDQGFIKIEKINENDLMDDIYVNEANPNTVGIYVDEKWKIKIAHCIYNSENSSCYNNDIDLDIGSYCVFNREIYLITDINDKGLLFETKTCIPGNEERTMFVKDQYKNTLMKVKQKSIEYIKKEGYYIFDAHNNEILIPKEMEISPTPLVYCKYGGECNIQESSIGYYLNELPLKYNVVQYISQESNEEMIQINNNLCIVESNESNENNHTCHGINGKLNIGDSCIFSNSLYFVADNEHCIMVEETIISYQFTVNKLYMLNNDNIIQLFDGYYFMNDHHRAIDNPKDYSKISTSCYKCNEMGDCYLLEPGNKIKYFPDDTTKFNNTYNIIKYDPEINFTSRTDINSYETKNRVRVSDSHYLFEIVTEAGFYELDSGYFSECELNIYDELECHHLNKVGVMKTINDVIIICNKNDIDKIECKEVMDGGYYVINNELHECDPNSDGNQIECKPMNKEGYFMSSYDDTLYNCKNINKSFVNENNNNDINNNNNNNNNNNESIGDIDEFSTIQDSSDATSTEFEEEPTDSIEIHDIEIVCQPVECSLGDNIYYETEINLIDMYQYSQIENTNDCKWISLTCISGNYRKDINGFYQCEDEKESIHDKFIERPNAEYTSTISSNNKLTTAFTDTIKTTSKIETTTFTDTIETTSKIETTTFNTPTITKTTLMMNSSTTTTTITDINTSSSKLSSTFTDNPTKTTVTLTSTTKSNFSTEIESIPKENSNNGSKIIITILLIIIIIVIILIIVVYLFKKKLSHNNSQN